MGNRVNKEEKIEQIQKEREGLLIYRWLYHQDQDFINDYKSEDFNEQGITEYKFKLFQFQKVNTFHKHGAWPRPRSGHRIVCNDNNIFLYGGYNPKAVPGPLAYNADDDDWHCSRPVFRELWEFNTSTLEWLKLPAINVPYVLASNAVALQGSVLMVYGGTGVPFGGHCSNLLYICDLKEEMPIFEEVEVTGDVPEPQYGQAVFIKENYLYTVGGTNGYDYTCDIHRLEMNTGIWEWIHSNLNDVDEPSGRYRHELGLRLQDSKIYVIGGGTALMPCGLQEIPIFHLEERTWTTLVTYGDPNFKHHNNGFPEPRSFHSLVQFPNGDDVFICGGECDSYPLSDSWKLNLVSGQWTKISNLELPTPRFFHSATLSPQGKMYVFGGVTNNDAEDTNTATERSDELLEAWMCIPKLSEMCWDALRHYNFLNIDNKKDLQTRLPKMFSKRLNPF